ncbi:MAG TPA: hypothetical protein VIL16_13495 [Trebonia sp.]
MAWAWVMPRAVARCPVAARSAAVSGPSARAILIASARYHSLASTWSWLPKATILGASPSAGPARSASRAASS